MLPTCWLPRSHGSVYYYTQLDQSTFVDGQEAMLKVVEMPNSQLCTKVLIFKNSVICYFAFIEFCHITSKIIVLLTSFCYPCDTLSSSHLQCPSLNTFGCHSHTIFTATPRDFHSQSHHSFICVVISAS